MSPPDSGSSPSMRTCATATYFSSRSMPIQSRPSSFATAPVVPVPKNGSRTMSPGSVHASRTRYSSASGFCVGCALVPPDLSRSAPVQIGSSQSLRICRSSLSAFIAW